MKRASFNPLRKNRVESQRGAILIESMVALTIFSVALLSLAGLQLGASKSAFSSLLKTESAVSVSEMIDKMRSNVGGITAGQYDIAYADNPPTTPTTQGARDLSEWFNDLQNTSLTGTTADAQIACTGLNCSIRLRWDDSRAVQGLTATDNASNSNTTAEYIFDVNF